MPVRVKLNALTEADFQSILTTKVRSGPFCRLCCVWVLKSRVHSAAITCVVGCRLVCFG